MDTNQTITLLETFLSQRYNPDAALLDLTSMYSDQFLLSNGMLSAESTKSKMFPALMAIAQRNKLKIDSVSLAANNLTDVTSVTTLAATFPHLKNLSLANNVISQWRHIDPWRHKFRDLRELILTGNPLVNVNNYRNEIIRRFPSLKMLDGQVVENISIADTGRGRGSPAQSFGIDVKKLPIHSIPGFFETSEIQSLVMPFLGQFLSVYDGDRSQLAPLYDDLSTFSISVNTSAPRELTKGHFNNFGLQHWSQYIPLSRNLTRITSSAPRQTRLAVGPAQILQLLKKIPLSRHDLQSPEKFSIESYTARNLRADGDTGIILIVHGEFEEGGSTQQGPRNTKPTKRSFDRTLLLLPGPQGSILVVSDLLSVRPWAGSRAWTK
ncbi:hypothetical protein V1514DRAFT_333228 [Lipomyces japonicus]|uniref:uncharacterized protein n=1 Tax=Lipomyces japonicus TaxID=56871 RepID=UPI0034CF1246